MSLQTLLYKFHQRAMEMDLIQSFWPKKDRKDYPELPGLSVLNGFTYTKVTLGKWGFFCKFKIHAMPANSAVGRQFRGTQKETSMCLLGNISLQSCLLPQKLVGFCIGAHWLELQMQVSPSQILPWYAYHEMLWLWLGGNKSKDMCKKDAASINTLRNLMRKAEQAPHTQCAETSSSYPITCRYSASWFQFN